MHEERSFYSFVIPVYNEEESLQDLVDRINKTMKDNYSFEIIFVNDGSTDKSSDIIKEFTIKYDYIKVINFKANFGKAAALNEGFKLSQGDFVITMDADLQDNPEEVPKLINKINEGYDLVSGWKQERKDPLEKKLPSKLFNKITSAITGLKLNDFNSGFKIYRKEVVNELDLYGELHRFIPALVYWNGNKVAEVPVKHSPRLYGKTKYGLRRYFHGLFDFMTVFFLTKFICKPMHFFGILGISSTLIGFLICLYLLIIWFSGESIGDRPLLMLGVLLIILGFQFISTGLIGELVLYLSKKSSNNKI